ANALLKLPSALHEEIDRRSGMPSGRLLPVADTPYDFTGGSGARLGTMSLDDSFVHLKQGLMDSGPVAELRDPRSNYGLRITALSPAIKAMRVVAPADESFVSIDPEFNFDDPFGREWEKGEDTGMVVLQPGQTVQWRVRLEIFPLTGKAPGML
ncbi:MAG: aldose 1-epimerase, partial [Acidobacteriales bacterium]|nr:aldose 1-epimerase [Terriglobales bacterium]